MLRFYVTDAKKVFTNMGITVDECDISTLSFNQIEEKIQKNDYIYISGGNTFFLLQDLIKTKSDTLILKTVNNGKLYIGESAGSMITSPCIEYVKLMDNMKKAPTLETFKALALVDFFVVPHYNNFPFKSSTNNMIKTYPHLNLKPITNNQAIIVENRNMMIQEK